MRDCPMNNGFCQRLRLFHVGPLFRSVVGERPITSLR
jgi:hypothetical protein